jgi:hypothetical protein
MPCGQPKLSSIPSAPCVLGAANDVVPRFGSRFHHQRHEHGMMRVIALDFGDLAKIVLQGAVGDQLDVVQAGDLASVVVDRPVARADVDDRLAAEGFPNHPAPSGIEGPPHLIRRIGRRRRSQPERIRCLHPAEFDRQISHAEYSIDSLPTSR